MLRTLMCLPLCLILAPSYPTGFFAGPNSDAARVYVSQNSGDGLPDPGKETIRFLQACMKRYEDTVQGYTLSFVKQERTLGKLNPWESIEACYREKPHAVFFDWQEGVRSGGPMKALYVAGENVKDGKSQILALPAPPLTGLGVQARDPDSPDSKKSGRYPLTEFGLKQGLQRVLDAWSAADRKKTLHIDYPGQRPVAKLDGRICYEVRRHDFAEPEGEDGIGEVTVFIDRETLFLAGTIVKGKDGELLGEYYFRNVELNPTFSAEQFTRAMLKAKR